MGIDYTLYHPATRTYFYLGKYLVHFTPFDENTPFQENRVAAFLATRPYGEFVLCNDMTGGLEAREAEECERLSDIHTPHDSPWREVTREECTAMMREGKTERPTQLAKGTKAKETEK